MHKCTKQPGERLKVGSCACSETPLDTSEQLPPDTSQEQTRKKLINRARSKYITNVVAAPLATLRSPLEKAYKLSTRCAGELTEEPGKLSGLYCGCRWCVVCARIRTAKLMAGYLPALDSMSEKWFLTLSRPNVVGAALEGEIKYYLRTASLIQRHLREKKKIEYSSLRKIECTYNDEKDTYHPHFHFIFDSWEAANAFLQEWLARNPKALLDKGNQLKKADNGSVRELFKYFAKIVSKSKTKAAGGTGYRIHLAALDCMFVALRAVRTFQPCGVVKFVSEEIEPEQALDSGRLEVNHWKWLNSDWVNVDTAQLLTRYQPERKVLAIAPSLVYPAGVVVAPAADLTPYWVDKVTGEVLGNEHAHELRNSMHYAKIYPALDQAPAASRRKPCNLVSVDWESQRQELELPAPVQLESTQLVPVAQAPAPGEQVQLFAVASGHPRPQSPRRAAPSMACPGPGVPGKLLSVKNKPERRSRPSPAQVLPLVALSSDALLFS